MTPERIFLIGYRGTGKTTIGRVLAERLGWTFLDADAVLEDRFATTIRDIFATEGEAGFRDKEAMILAELATRSQHIIATGGGVVLRPANRDVLRTGTVLWLTAPPEVLLERIEADPTTAARRPNLTASGGLDEIRRLLAVREPLYRECADQIIDASMGSPDAIVADIVKGLGMN